MWKHHGRDRPPTPRAVDCHLLEHTAKTQINGQQTTVHKPLLPTPGPATCEPRVVMF